MFLIFLCLFPALLQAREASGITGDSFEEISGRGLVIRTNPSGVKVFIDGAERGITPLTFDNLLPGEHSVRLNKEGYRERNFNVTLFSTSRLVVSIEMEEERGVVMVSVHRAAGSPETLPLNPQIYTGALNETETAVTLSSDNALLSLPTGYRTIRARAFGWEDSRVTVLVDGTNAVTADIYMKPAVFKLENISQSRRRFNPMNSGSLGVTEYRFEVSAPGAGTITITDRDGLIVFEKRLGAFDSWFQSVSWDGRDDNGRPLPKGIYTILIEASALQEFSADYNETVSLKLETEIDYSAGIFPLSLKSGISGLTFAPMPNVLPPGSYQFEAGIAYVNSFLPFEIGMRVSPFKKMELATVFNINPRLENKTGWGITGSAKYNFFDSDSSPLLFAAGVSYAWASENGDAPLSAGRGVGLFTPLSLELSNFSIVFTPAIFWRGPEGLVPALLLSAGALYNGGWFNTGLSMRCEFDFTENAESPKFLSGAQVYFLPPPSNFFVSLSAGLWTQNSNTGGYGGITIGLLY
jgi:hypothetical protein